MSPMSPRLLRPRASGAFNPSTIANLAAWWDLSDPARYTLVDGVVSSLTDKTGTYTLTQSIAGNRPSIATINGRSAFGFNGTSTILTSTAPVVPWGTYFWVARMASVSIASGRSVYAAGRTSPSNEQMFLGQNINWQGWSVGRRNASAFTQIGGPYASTEVNTTKPFVCSVVAETGTSSLSYRENKVAQTGAGGSSAAPNVAQVSIGARNTSGGILSYFSGEIGEILWYSRALNATEISSVESYLSNRWKVGV